MSSLYERLTNKGKLVTREDKVRDYKQRFKRETDESMAFDSLSKRLEARKRTESARAASRRAGEASGWDKNDPAWKAASGKYIQAGRDEWNAVKEERKNFDILERSKNKRGNGRASSSRSHHYRPGR